MKPKMTLKKIASELGLSISTVSKALKNNKDISKENREKVQAFAKFYNYRPNSVALSLKNKKTKTIGVIIPEIVHHYFAKVISGIEEVANSKEYNVIIGVTNESYSKEIINMEMLIDGSIDGFIISLSKQTLQKKDYTHLQETINQSIPIVMFDRAVEEIPCDKIIIDDREAGKMAIQRLVDEGRKKILLLTTKDYLNIGRLRTEGYRDALLANQIPYDEDLIVRIGELGDSDEDQRNLEERINKVFELHPDIDGIFGVNEIYAVTAMNVARMRGLDVPEQLSVIGFSDGILSKYARPHLTTVSQHGFQMGELAAETLINRLEKMDDDVEVPYETRVVKTDLIIRDSTRNKITN
ncbi:LacI family DNA-binding transcriptional regulator [Flagellimonas okinawensis]|uniref:LacI family DNA-binding transcriptional regulator n=1 Tax=Flagellimonas okinawensis TaxID=3031324 RepID=A0ABT5XKS0_9FLAO|nr:LacI family DNA-binding transcriptional regulator [[Muricauda] okinawensis]MDF0706493.1 LacI family DNA-binding transcriptional regulator [[Muricauda] okinawensis]